MGITRALVMMMIMIMILDNDNKIRGTILKGQQQQKLLLTMHFESEFAQKQAV